jgi:hypothetical protein
MAISASARRMRRPHTFDGVSGLTYRHPWVAAAGVGAVVFSIVWFVLEMGPFSISSPGPIAALIGSLVALPIGRVWQGDPED